MEGFTYSNLFDTKGTEYLIVIAFLLLLIPFWMVLNRKSRLSERIRGAIGVLSSGILRIPQGLYYSGNHTWLFLERNGIAKLGLDDLLLHITGDVKLNYKLNIGDMVNKGDLLAEIDQNGRKLSIYSPVSGKIHSQNTALAENPGLLSDDPCGKGWIYAVKPTNWKSDIATCYLAEEASLWSEQELKRYKDFLAVSVQKYSPDVSMLALQDGGELIDHSLSAMPENVWNDFGKEFLQPL